MEPHRTLQTVLADYQQRKANHEQHLSRIQQRIYRIGTIRLLLFVAAIAGAIYFRHEGWTVVVPVIVVCLVPFLILMKVHDRLFYDKDYTQQLIDINANELAALDYRTDCFDGGKDFQDPAHPYSYDLDLFGDRSLFQYINRTSTYFGRQRLAGWFARPLDRKADIELRQDAVQPERPRAALYLRNLDGERDSAGMVRGFFPEARGLKTATHTMELAIDRRGTLKRVLLYDDVRDPYQLQPLDPKACPELFASLCGELAVLLRENDDVWYRERVLAEWIPYDKEN